jgi:DnaJ-class molecular chaperone
MKNMFTSRVHQLNCACDICERYRALVEQPETKPEKCKACDGTGDSRKIAHPDNTAWNRTDMGCRVCGATGFAPNGRQK